MQRAAAPPRARPQLAAQARPHPHRGWVTMEDVARAAGVSAMTVSRVLKTPDKVAESTRARVRAAIDALGYVPDSVAGALASRESRLVAALVSTMGGSIFTSTIDGLNAALAEADHQLLLGTTEYSARSEEALLVTLLGRRPDGLVLTSTEHTATARRMLAAAQIPVVEIWDLPKTPIDTAVGFCNRSAGEAMARLLVELGYRRIGFLAGSVGSDRRGRLRRKGYEAVITAAGLGPPRSLAAPPKASLVDAGAAALGPFLERWPDTDAIFCASDALALGVYCEARRRGLAVPGRLAVAGFGDFEFAGDAGLGFTTVSIPGRRIGTEAGRLLLARKSGAPGLPHKVDVGFTVIRRLSA